ncbi:mechanosensitive ion channel family protein [Formosa sp. PL04]|uniref:mechanosensitive ion channel family protein n=1 Tax=Formosa sp. PL04 TaxID=3081755 RepID=UPI0029815270|nr:mechanosensitive ion channel domain-containing protein [Formosa sp. PL04]MDW5287581.1 mechanosensitive ion channel [Formosa sp. PL04]
MKKHTKLIISILVLILVMSIQLIADFLTRITGLDFSILTTQKSNLFIAASAWVIIVVLRLLKTRFLRHYDISEEDNLHSRKIYTQFNILEKVLIFIIIISAIGFILLSFDGIRKIGMGLFASAGIAGIILGLSAQKVVGALFAGIQIAITQPFRIDDAVVVEGEWGWIEEINLTYVVIRIWDKRRLVLPSTYFLEKPFQNWTRNNADIMGTIFLYTDYNIPFDDLRTELTRLLKASDLWDGKVNVLQVTESKETTVESRILVSAKNSPMAWDLRVHIREKMIVYIQKNYPDSLPRTRFVLENKAS